MFLLDHGGAGRDVVSLLLVVVGLAVGSLATLSERPGLRLSGLTAIWTCGLLILGLRDFSAAPDYGNYAEMYYDRAGDLARALATYHGDWTFSLSMWLGHSLGLGFDAYLILFSAFCLALVGVGFALMAPRQAPLALALFLATSTFVFLNINVLRQGLAMALMVFALGLWVSGRQRLALPVLLAMLYAHGRTAWLILGALGGSAVLQRLRPLTLPAFTTVLLVASLIVAFVVLPVVVALDLPGAGQITRHAGRSGVTSELLLYTRIVLLWLVAVLMVWSAPWQEEGLRRGVLEAYIALCALTTAVLPVTLASGRLVYMASALVPPLIASLLSLRLERVSRPVVVSTVLLGGLLYATFNYSFPSVTRQLGFGWLDG